MKLLFIFVIVFASSTFAQSTLSERDFEYGYWGVRQERLKDIISTLNDGKRIIHPDTGYEEAGGKKGTLRFIRKEEKRKTIITYLFNDEDRLYAGEVQYDVVIYNEAEIGEVFFLIKKQYDEKYGKPTKYKEIWGDAGLEKEKNIGLAVLLGKLTIEVIYRKNKTQVKLTLMRNATNLGYSIKAVFLPYPHPKKDG